MMNRILVLWMSMILCGGQLFAESSTVLSSQSVLDDARQEMDAVAMEYHSRAVSGQSTHDLTPRIQELFRDPLVEGDRSVSEVCVIECPDGIVPSPEPDCYDGYQDVANAGCSTPPGMPRMFESLACNDTVCGTSGSYTVDDIPYDDQDWFRFTVSGANDSVIFTIDAERDGIFYLWVPGTPDSCWDGSILYFGMFTGCNTFHYRSRLLPREYWVYISIGMSAPCGSKYVMSVECLSPLAEECECPLVADHYPSTSTPVTIPDNTLTDPCLVTGGISNTIVVAGSGIVTDVNVDVTITHTWVGDLAISLSHLGETVTLKSRPAGILGPNCDNIFTTFDDEGNPWIPGECPHPGCVQPYDGLGCPANDLSVFDGLSVEGEWTLNVADGFPGTSGVLESWGLCITAEDPPCVPDPAIVTFAPADGLPQHQCIHVCPDDSSEIIVGPGLDEGEQPIMYFSAGCRPPVGGEVTCNDPDCPPAESGTCGWWFEPSDGSWHKRIAANAGTAAGCVCVSLDGYLAAELASFEALPGDGEITLRWTTASEIDNDHFLIQRDATTVGRVEAYNAATGGDYSWTERNLTNGREYSYTLVAVDVNGTAEEIGTVSATPTMGSATVTEYSLHQNYPNPFNPSTTISFDLVNEQHVTLIVYNPLGQIVATLINHSTPEGRHTVSFDGSSLSSGLYFYRIEAGHFTATRKMILMK